MSSLLKFLLTPILDPVLGEIVIILFNLILSFNELAGLTFGFTLSKQGLFKGWI
jgi:hypothetical protein